jgi:hypothetical protein
MYADGSILNIGINPEKSESATATNTRQVT